MNSRGVIERYRNKDIEGEKKERISLYTLRALLVLGPVSYWLFSHKCN